MEPLSNTTFYGSNLVTNSNAEQLALCTKKNVHQQEPEKLQALDQQQQQHQQSTCTTKQQNSQILKQTSTPNGGETPLSHLFQSTSQNKNRGPQNYLMDYSNYYSIQAGYPATQNAEFLNSASSVSSIVHNAYPDYQSGFNRAVSPIAQTTNQESPLKQQQQYVPSQTQYNQPIYSLQSPYLIFQQQDFYAANLGNRPRSNQQQTYATKNGHQTLNSTSLQIMYQGEKNGLENDENEMRLHQNPQQLLQLQLLQQQQQQQQLLQHQPQPQQQLLNQAFMNPSPMLYAQATLPQSSLPYTSPSILLTYYQGYAAQRQYQQPVAKPKPSVAGLARNQLVSSTLTNKSRNSSTFSSNEEHSRATSISSCIPQTEPEPHIVKPRIATYCWQEENTNCYQVRINKILVSRREDNNYINCTKLLNVTKMTRGKRDGILKTEKVKDVVKVGTMNLKGVWIPFDRAYEIARNEGIDELLHPLFVRNIKEYFLTGGHKLKSEEEDAEEIENLRTTKIEGKSNLEVLDESNSSYNKSASCPTGEYATSLSSNDSN